MCRLILVLTSCFEIRAGPCFANGYSLELFVSDSGSVFRFALSIYRLILSRQVQGRVGGESPENVVCFSSGSRHGVSLLTCFSGSDCVEAFLRETARVLI